MTTPVVMLGGAVAVDDERELDFRGGGRNGGGRVGGDRCYRCAAMALREP